MRHPDRSRTYAMQRGLPTKGSARRARLTGDEYQLLKAFAKSHEITMSSMFRLFTPAMRQLDEQEKTITEWWPPRQNRDRGV
jgi:hypothetical protein